MYSPASSSQMLLRSEGCKGVREDHCDVLEHDIQSFAWTLRRTPINLQSEWTDISICSPPVTNQYWRCIKCLLLSVLRSSVGTAVHRTKGPLSLPSISTRASNYTIVLRRHSQTLAPHVYAICRNYTVFTGECVSTVTGWIAGNEVFVKIGNIAFC